MTPEEMLGYAEQNLKAAELNLGSAAAQVHKYSTAPGGVPLPLTISTIEAQIHLGEAWAHLADVKLLEPLMPVSDD